MRIFGLALWFGEKSQGGSASSALLGPPRACCPAVCVLQGHSNEAAMRITGLSTYDLRFPTSASLDGSDAMPPDPDYSAAYVVIEPDGPQQGHGLTFTIGRGS